MGGEGGFPQAPPLASPSPGVNKRTHSLWPIQGANGAGAGSCKPRPRPFPPRVCVAPALTPPPGNEAARSAHRAPPSGQRATRALCPPCPLARLQMAAALGPTCAPRPLRRPGPICPQAPAQRGRDKYTRTPGVPAGQIGLSGARRGSAPGPAPGPSSAPLRDPLQFVPASPASGSPSHTARDGTRSPAAPAPKAAISCCPACRGRQAPRRRSASPGIPAPARSRALTGGFPDLSPERAGFQLYGSWGACPGQGERGELPRARLQTGKCTVGLCPPGALGGGRRTQRYLARRVGDARRSALAGAVRSAPGRAQRRGMKGARPRPWPAPGPPIPSGGREEGLVWGEAEGRGSGPLGAEGQPER